jgi:hypothetical protein
MKMSSLFSPETVRRCWELAQGRCECQRDAHGHEGRCDKPLEEGRHGMLRDDGWFTTSWEPGGADKPENCEALCWSCYARTKQAT